MLQVWEVSKSTAFKDLLKSLIELRKTVILTATVYYSKICKENGRTAKVPAESQGSLVTVLTSISNDV